MVCLEWLDCRENNRVNFQMKSAPMGNSQMVNACMSINILYQIYQTAKIYIQDLHVFQRKMKI